MKRLTSLLAVTAAGALAAAGTASGDGASLPTLHVAVGGAKTLAVSGSMVSGAVNITSSFTGRGQGDYGLVRLNPGVTEQQLLAGAASNPDPNSVDPYGAIVVDAGAPSTVQTVLAPGNYVAINLTGQAPADPQAFTVTPSSAPAALPAVRTTQTAIEFGFRGPRVLHNGTVVRTRNDGYLVHMVNLIGVRSKAAGKQVVALLKAGKDHKAMGLMNHSFVSLAGPISHGAVQQQVLHAAPGWYVEACFMDTQDHREHTQLGMERLVRIVR